MAITESKLKLHWKTALTYVSADPDWRRKLFIGGLLFIPLPPIGWLFALGFRSLTGSRLIEGVEPVLTSWDEKPGRIFLRGLGASAVILTYFVPFLFVYWILGLNQPSDLLIHSAEIAVFIGAVILLPPLFLPLMTLGYPLRYSWLHFSIPEGLLLSGVFVITVFIMPAVFVQVALKGGYIGAFNLPGALRFISENFLSYLEAWALSILVSVVALALGPFAPWGIFWSYLVILYTFNEALSQWDRQDVRDRFKESLLLAPAIPRRLTC